MAVIEDYRSFIRIWRAALVKLARDARALRTARVPPTRVLAQVLDSIEEIARGMYQVAGPEGNRQEEVG